MAGQVGVAGSLVEEVRSHLKAVVVLEKKEIRRTKVWFVVHKMFLKLHSSLWVCAML